MYRLVRPLLFAQDAESIHNRVSWLLAMAGKVPLVTELVQKYYTVSSSRLSQTLFGLTFPNPVGLAAGMDKTGKALIGWQSLGFGFLEMGAVVPLPQYGNERPRMFRLTKDCALINRMGFNSDGAQEAEEILSRVKAKLKIPLGINLGKNKLTPLENAVNDYALTAEWLREYADFFVINVSSPNTPELRKLQGKDYLRTIVRGVQEKNLRRLNPYQIKKIPLLVKVSPDLTMHELDDVLEVVTETQVNGIIAVNTTMSRSRISKDPGETGGLSGPPLRPLALTAIRHIRKVCPKLPLIGVGGISNGNHALAFMEAGANLVQVLTGLVYEGPGLPRAINRTLLRNGPESLFRH